MIEAEVSSAQKAFGARGSPDSQQIHNVAPGHFVLSGEFDASNSHELQSALDAVPGAIGECILDCEAVLYMDSSALHVLARATRMLQKNGGKLVILSPSPFARALLEVSGIARGGNIEVRESH